MSSILIKIQWGIVF